MNQPPRPRRARLLLSLTAGCAALLLSALPMGRPAAATTADSGPLIAPELTISATDGLDPSGQTVTVTGRGYDPSAHVGTRPPLAGRPSGVYVVFGRFGDPWRPSQNAPSAARQITHQVWAVPEDAYSFLDPTGTNPEIVLLDVEGTFSATLQVERTDGEGVSAVATYPGSGAVNPTQEVLVPVGFESIATTASTTPSTTTSTTLSTTPPPTTAPPTTGAPSTTTTEPGPATATTMPVAATEERTAEGPHGQRLRVAPVDDLPLRSATVRVRGSGYDPGVGLYVALCVDQGPGAAPSPCVGGVDMEGSGSSSAWISSNPPAYAGDLATPFGPDGSFEVTLTVNAADEYVDCLSEGTRCVIASRADHTNGSNRTADVRVPVSFRGQNTIAPQPTEPTPTISLSAATVGAGATVDVAGAGFLAGEQVQIWLLSEPTLLSVATADADGAVHTTVTVPATIAAGTHHVELRGLTSGRTIRSAELTVTPVAPAQPAVNSGGADRGSATATGSGRTRATATGSLARTGTDLAVAPALLMIALGALLVAGSRRRNQSHRPIQDPGAS